MAMMVTMKTMMMMMIRDDNNNSSNNAMTYDDGDNSNINCNEENSYYIGTSCLSIPT